jgi:hypothetical protein
MDPKLAQCLMAGGPGTSSQAVSTNSPGTAMDPSLARSLLANGAPTSQNAPHVNTRPSQNNTHSAAVNPNSGLSQSPQYTRGLQAGPILEPHGIFTLRPPRMPVHPVYGPDPRVLDRSFRYCPRCYPFGVACQCKESAGRVVGPSCCTIL